ncbi:MAG: THUMP domain-containing protein [Candidatus Woesearchaeota archaeon]
MEYMLRFGEIGLKGGNRSLFEKKLENNISLMLKKQGADFTITRMRGRIFVQSKEPVSLRNVFGLVSYSPIARIEKDLESVKDYIRKNLLQKFENKRFKVVASRADKSFSKTSPEIEKELGMFIQENISSSVDLKNYNAILGVEVHGRGIILFTEIIRCFGGLPSGIEGRVVLLLDKPYSDIAGLLAMKRGCSIFPVAFEKKEISLLQRYSPEELTLEIIKDETEIRQVAAKNNCLAVISGQTIKDFEDIATGIPVLRPLVGYSEREIKELKQRYEEI